MHLELLKLKNLYVVEFNESMDALLISHLELLKLRILYASKKFKKIDGQLKLLK